MFIETSRRLPSLVIRINCGPTRPGNRFKIENRPRASLLRVQQIETPVAHSGGVSPSLAVRRDQLELLNGDPCAEPTVG